MKPLSLLLGAILLLLAFINSSEALTVTINPVADTFLSGSNASGNYGAAGALQVSAAGEAKGEMQTLLMFDLASTKATLDSTFGAGNWTINSITLELGTNFGTQGVQPNNAIFNTINGGAFKIDWLANDSWQEGTGTPAGATTDGATFNSLATLESASDKTLGTYTYTPVGNTNPPTVPLATYSLSLDPSFLSDVDAGNDVSLRLYAGDTGVSYLFNSRSFPTTASRPELVINVIPEPGTGALALAGMAFTATMGLARKKYARGK